MKEEERYDGSFNSREDVEREFCIKLPDTVEIVFAAYDTGDTSDAWVIIYDSFYRKYLEVFSGHCSCNGLEDSFDMEETSYKDLIHRLKDRNAHDQFNTELAFKAITATENKNKRKQRNY